MTLNRRVLKRVHSPLKSPKRNNTSLRKKALIKQLSGEVQFGAASKANVKVVVRIRPNNSKELENGDRSVIKTVDEHMMIFDPREENDDFFFKGVRQRMRDLNKRPAKEQKFIFERVFDVHSTNEEIYEETTKDLVDTILSGYNCSVFAYGATGAGKTFTMLGKQENPGITFLTLMELYRRIEELKEEKTCEVGVSYLEVYNETVRDLLQPGKLLNVQENGSQILVPGLSLHKPENAADLLKMLAFGNQNRSQHPTDANAESSRSHAVFQIFVRQQARTANLKSNVCIAKLSMIDLAGSERGAATGFRGARFREGANINKSLLALGNCINALADGLRHVPYRDSKLTRLLKDSLGGNCRSVMIAAVSPAVSSFEDTFNTLRYANRAKTIKTTLRKNLMNVDQHVTQYVKIVEDLREEICSLKERLKMYEEKEEEWESNKAALELANEALAGQEEANSVIASLQQQLEEKATATTKAQPLDQVSEEEMSIQRKLEETSMERKALRRELLQLESSQRELELKIYNCNIRLQRMKIVSSISQKLDKSISKCERTTRNLTNKLDQTKKLQLNVEGKLNANLAKLHDIQAELNKWGPNDSQPSQASKILMDKNETDLAERDLLQQTEYLRGILKDFVNEQSSSEHLICQLINIVRGFYVRLRANHVCAPEMEKLFESCIDSMDESKIIWADQQPNEEPVLKITPNHSGQTGIDVDRLTCLPIISNIFISPVVLQDNKVFLRSALKNKNSIGDSLKNVHSVLHPYGEADWKDDKSPISGEMDTDEQMKTKAGTPESPVLSVFSTCAEYGTPNPSPVIGGGSLPGRIFVPMSSSHVFGVNITSLVDAERISLVESRNVSNISPVPDGNGRCISQIAGGNTIQRSISPTYNCVVTSCSDPVSQLVRPSVLNVTVDIPSCSRTLNTTEVIPSKSPSPSAATSSLSLTNAFQIHETKTSAILNETVNMSPHTKGLNSTVALPSPKLNTKVEKSLNFLNTTIDLESHFKPLNTTVDLSDPVINIKTSPGFDVFTAQEGSVHATASEKCTSRKLFQILDLDSTYSVNLVPGSSEDCLSGISPVEKNPETESKPSIFVKMVDRLPLTSVENKSVMPKEVMLPLHVPSVTVEDSPMPPPSTNKKGLCKRSGITPHKTPGKIGTAAHQTKTFLSTKRTSGGLRRSLSTSSLAPVKSGSYQVSPLVKRRYNAIGGAIRKTSTFLKSNRHLGKNQENQPPCTQLTPKPFTESYTSLPHRDAVSSAPKHHFTQSHSSLPHRDTISSLAKHVLLHKT